MIDDDDHFCKNDYLVYSASDLNSSASADFEWYEKDRRIREERELAKQVRLEEKKIFKEKKKPSKKKMQKTENIPIEKEIIINAGIVKINTTSTEFNELLKKITKKNMLRSYPNINAIPN